MIPEGIIFKYSALITSEITLKRIAQERYEQNVSPKREKLKERRKSWIGKLTLSMILSKVLFLKDFEPRKFSSKIRIKERCNNVFKKKKHI